MHLHVYFSAPPQQQHEDPNQAEEPEEMTGGRLATSLVHDLKELIVQKATKSFLIHQSPHLLHQFEQGDFTLFHRDLLGDPVEILTDRDFTHVLSVQQEQFVSKAAGVAAGIGSNVSSHQPTVQRKTLDLEVVVLPEQQQEDQTPKDVDDDDFNVDDDDDHSNSNHEDTKKIDLPSSSSLGEDSYWYQWSHATTKATENMFTSLQDVTTSSVSHLRKTLVANGQSLVASGQSIGKSLEKGESLFANRVAKCILGATFAVAMVAIEQTAFTIFNGGRSYSPNDADNDSYFISYDQQEPDTTYC